MTPLGYNETPGKCVQFSTCFFCGVPVSRKHFVGGKVYSSPDRLSVTPSNYYGVLCQWHTKLLWAVVLIALFDFSDEAEKQKKFKETHLKHWERDSYAETYCSL